MAKLEFDIKPYNVGSILYVRLRDFVTYEYCEMSPGPYMNMILGPNGSGKSTLVAAIALGLGAPLSIMGRASTISQYVKYGRDKGIIEITLKKSSEESDNIIIIKRVFKRNDNQSEWFLDGVKSTHAKVTEVVKALNIQLDNLCQFLPQDKVFEFARLSQQELLIETQKAVASPQFLQYQQQLIELRHSVREKTRAFEILKEEINLKEKNNERLQKLVERYRERELHNERILILKLKRPWVIYNDARVIYLSKKEHREKTLIELEKEKSAIQPIKAELMEFEKNYTKEDRELSRVKLQIEQSTRSGHSIIKKMNEYGAQVASIEDKIKSLVERESQRKRQIEEIRSEIQIMEEKMKTPPSINLNDVDLEIEEKHGQKQNIDDIMSQITSEKLQISREGSMLNSKINEANEKLKEVENIRNRRLQLLQREEKDTFEAWQWFNQHQHEFRGLVHEPVCLEINLKDYKYASIVESGLSRQAMTSFVFENEGDYNYFLSEVGDKRKLRVNAVQIKTKLNNYNPLIPIEELKQYGFTEYLINVIDAPESVLTALCEYFKIHLQPVALGKVVYAKIDELRAINKYFAEDNIYEVKRDAHTGRVNAVTSKPLKHPKLFSDKADATVKDQLLRGLQEFRSKLQRNSEVIKDLITKEQKQSVLSSSIENEIRNLLKRRNELKNELVQFNNLTKLRDLKLRELENLLNEKSRQSLEAEYKSELKKVVGNQVAEMKNHAEAMKVTSELLHEKTLIALRSMQLNVHVVQKKAQIEAFEFNIQDVQAEFNRGNLSTLVFVLRDILADAEFDNARRNAKELLGVAKSHPLDKTMQEKFSELPDTIEEIDALIATETARAELTTNVSQRDVEAYEKQLKEIEALKRNHVTLETECTSLSTEMMRIENLWIPPLEDLISCINANFMNFFKFIHCVGQVQLHRAGQDYDSWGINILVKFRDEEALHSLDSERQSGGERSVSTILYLMALQELSTSPFRVVDEINQGMDPRNERLVHSLITDVATKPNTSQYFLITPKLLLDLSYNEKMKILCVLNGPWLPDPSEWNMNRFLPPLPMNIY